jgi:hypothetical protein
METQAQVALPHQEHARLRIRRIYVLTSADRAK